MAATWQAPFEVPARAEDLAIYEVNIRAFSQAGNLAGVQERLPALKRLGINVVWLMPIFPTGKVRSSAPLGSPYSVSNYRLVNPEFGTLLDLKAVVAKAHELGMGVILDWVANHTAWDNPWIGDHPDWYLQDVRGNIVIPPGTNYQDVAQLNFQNQSMRHEMIDSMRYWIDVASVDGFRCDMADAIPSSFWKPAISELRQHAARRILMLAEGTKPEHFSEGFDVVYGWSFCTALKDVFQRGATAKLISQTDAREKSGMDDRALLRYTTNHDECAWSGSPIQIYGGEKGALAAFAIACTMGGTPLVYTGQENAWPEKISFFEHAPINWQENSHAEQTYVKLLRLRSASSALKVGDAHDFSSDSVLSISRRTPTQQVVVIVNVRPFTSSYDVPDSLVGRYIDLWADSSRKLAGQIELRPHEFLILKR